MTSLYSYSHVYHFHANHVIKFTCQCSIVAVSAAMTSQVYNLPVVLPALRKEESYHQLVDALEYLDAVASDIFNRVSCRVAESRDQLTTINNRVNVAQAKIDKLRNSSSKATRVFSAPKYPAPERLSDTTTVYQEVNPLLQRVRKTKVDVESRLEEVTREVVAAKRKPFLLNPKKKKKVLDLRFASDDPEQGEGLGSLPHHLPSVSSLLLFNTSENPYKKYVVLDPLSGATVKTRDNLNQEEDSLTDAPVTITQGEELLSGPQDSVMYVPVMPELPELEVPELLPSLPYVAADMFYTADIGKSIAPSLANVTVTVPELPNLADPTAPAAIAVEELESGGCWVVHAQTTLSHCCHPTGVPPPPPPPEPAPPPTSVPQPPGDSSSEEEEEGEEGEGEGGEGGGDATGDDRANLMEAIRKAGKPIVPRLTICMICAYPARRCLQGRAKEC